MLAISSSICSCLSRPDYQSNALSILCLYLHSSTMLLTLFLSFSSSCSGLNREQVNRKLKDRWIRSATWQYLHNCVTCSTLCLRPHVPCLNLTGSDFIKTSTGKEAINATYPVAIVMVRAIRNYFLCSGHKVQHWTPAFLWGCEYFLVNQKKLKWAAHCTWAAWKLSSLPAVWSNSNLISSIL